MTGPERLALAMLRGGRCSFEHTMHASRLTLEQVKAVYEAAPSVGCTNAPSLSVSSPKEAANA